jgi:glycosyltransferase involved in cell wall biosynthesis
MRVLVWQWGRRGAGPRFAVSLADGLRLIPCTEALLSLSASAEILRGSARPHCDLPVATYAGAAGLAWRLAQSPLIVPRLVRQVAALRPDVAICAMPGPLDLQLLAALRRIRVPGVVVVHDADAHPGDAVPLLMTLQRQLTRRADAVVPLSQHVAARLQEQQLVDAARLFVVPHPPFRFGPMPPPPRAHGGVPRLLCFGRLLPYKGLDLLASAMRQLGARREWVLRVVGSGPESADLNSLRALPGVTVENRWVPEDEVGALFAWADVLVLPYKEASQSGVAPAAIAAGRVVVSTRVGGLVEQLGNKQLATLCEPDAASLAVVLRNVLDASPATSPGLAPADPRLAWRDVAERLLDRIASSGVAVWTAGDGFRAAKPILRDSVVAA